MMASFSAWVTRIVRVISRFRFSFVVLTFLPFLAFSQTEAQGSGFRLKLRSKRAARGMPTPAGRSEQSGRCEEAVGAGFCPQIRRRERRSAGRTATRYACPSAGSRASAQGFTPVPAAGKGSRPTSESAASLILLFVPCQSRPALGQQAGSCLRRAGSRPYPLVPTQRRTGASHVFMGAPPPGRLSTCRPKICTAASEHVFPVRAEAPG